MATARPASAFNDAVQEVDDSEYTSTSNLPSMKNTMDTTSSIMTDTSDSTFKTPTHTSSGAVPRVPLPVASGKSRLRSLLMWEDRRKSGVVFALCMVFFYMTLWRGLSILSVCGAILGTYLTLGMTIVYINNALNGPLDKFIKKQPRPEKFFRKDVVEKWSNTFMDIGNWFTDNARDVLYCEDWKATFKWIGISFAIYVLGIWFSPLVILFLATLVAFSLPLMYERNKKQVDETAAMALKRSKETAAQAYDVSLKKASEAREVMASKLEKSHPVVRDTARKVGLTPQRKTATKPMTTTMKME